MSYKILVMILISMFLTFSLVLGNEKIAAKASLENVDLSQSTIISVPVEINMSSSSAKLGSYTASLTWNADLLEYDSYTGGTVRGFESPVVNDVKVLEGELRFASANPFGSEGVVNVINVNFKYVGKKAEEVNVNLDFSALAAAESFDNLLPQLEVEIGEGASIGTALPLQYKLEENYPNPFNPTTEIPYQIQKDGLVQIAVYNMLGQKVKVLVNEKQEAGPYTVRWNGLDDRGNKVPSGTYLLKIKSKSFSDSIRMMLVK